MVKESKEVYKKMDQVIFKHANSLVSPDNLRAELEQEAGESKPTPHYIVAAYPRPGAVLTHIVMQFVKEFRKQSGTARTESAPLKAFVSGLMEQPAQRCAAPKTHNHEEIS
jgi:hypothetical protein